ncbi:MAG: hypothetical protein ACOYVK_15970 [Bacillota bacterium]
MPNLIRQTITQKKFPVKKLIAVIFGAIVGMEIVIKLLIRVSPALANIGGIAALIAAGVGCTKIIYSHIVYFNYKIIDDDFVMERVISTSNHMFLSLKLYELECLQPYDEMYVKNAKQKYKVYKFVTGKMFDEWYIGEFTRSSDRYLFIIQPNEDLLNVLRSYCDCPCQPSVHE